jgi:hypothetical protein
MIALYLVDRLRSGQTLLIIGCHKTFGEDVTGAFGELLITFNKSGTISVANAVPPIWNAAGVFELVKTGSVFTLHRDDGIEITVVELDADQLVMEFDLFLREDRLGNPDSYVILFSLLAS